MKKALSLVFALVLCLSLCACGENAPTHTTGNILKPAGSYTAMVANVNFATITFSGNNVTYTSRISTSEGSFIMDGNKVIVNYTNGNGDTFTYNAQSDTLTISDLVFRKDNEFNNQQNSETNSRGQISIEDLFEELENEAKAQLNIGKETIVFGKIHQIKADYCVVELMEPYPQEHYVTVSMGTERLAQLKTGGFIAVSGLVAEFRPNAEYLWDISGVKIEDTTTMDAIIRKYMENIASYGNCIPEFDGAWNLAFLQEYLDFRGEAFALSNATQLQQYLLGKWNHNGYLIDFMANGEFTSDLCYIYAMDFKWDIVNGKLDAMFASTPAYVYVLSDDVFMCGGSIVIRQK